MDITYTSEFDAKRYGKIIGRTLGLVAFRRSILCWCLLIGGLVSLATSWMKGFNVSQEKMFFSFFLIFLPLMICLVRRICATQYVKAVARMMGGNTTSHCHLTDDSYEVTCGEMSQKMPWKNLGTHYHFFDDDTVALLQPNGTPSLALGELRARGIGRAELEAVFRAAGMKTLGESKKRKVWMIVSCALGVFFVFTTIMSLAFSVRDRREALRLQDVQTRLFDQIHGKDDPRRPPQFASPQATVVRTVCGEDAPDSLTYLFDPKGEEDKVGLFAQYGERAYVAFYPCGCIGWHDHSADCDCLREAGTLEFYSEAEKEKWLEKVRPIARELYEADCCGDCD